MPDRAASTLPVPAPRRGTAAGAEPDERPGSDDVLGVGMVGYAGTGAVHSRAWASAGRFFDLPRPPAMVALCGPDRGGVARAASRLGWWSYETDWRQLLDRDDVDLVDVCTPADLRAGVAVAALEAGRHVLCAAPLASTVAEAEAMARAADAAERRGVRSTVGFALRLLPAVVLARRLVAQGRLGAVRQVRVQHLQGWGVDPDVPPAWRLRQDRTGAGALADLGAHVVDLAQHLLGSPVVSVCGLTDTLGPQRPAPTDDAALFLARFGSGAVGSVEVTRCAAGRRNALRFELDGSQGSLAFDLDAPDELLLHERDADQDLGTAGRRLRVAGPQDPYADPSCPTGGGLGLDHAVTTQVVDLVQDVVQGRTPSPSFRDGLQVQRVLAAVQRSATERCWQDVPGGD